MVLELARSAVFIKLSSKAECPLISAYEYCFAAGYAFAQMKVPENKKDEIRDLADFSEMKMQVTELLDTFDIWESIANGERLKDLLTGCRITAEIDDQARILFDIGYQEA